MADIRPFAAIKYVPSPKLHVSDVIAPPYDVLNEAQKASLQARHPNNIVTIDLPFMPPKSVGPDEVYARADVTLKAWLSAGILRRDARSATYPYQQSFDYGGKTFHRRGFVSLVRLSPFGQGQVIPHEKTYQGPIEDRLKLMRATAVQLSPIFGLFSDATNQVTKLLYQNVGKPELDGTLEGVRHQLWSVIDAELENRIIELMGTKPVYIADGHHRYTTALAYQKEIERQAGGALPADHPANFCMFVLVGMQSDGLLVLPTHRLVGGLGGFDAERFKSLVRGAFAVSDTPLTPDKITDYAASILPQSPPHTMGLYDGINKKLYQLTLTNPDVLAKLEPNYSDVWRRLDVAILQRYLLDEILRKNFASAGQVGDGLTIGYTADPREIAEKTDGRKYQVAVLLKATPLHALEELGKTGEVMPQKSTYFYPKLATGMTIYPLR